MGLKKYKTVSQEVSKKNTLTQNAECTNSLKIYVLTSNSCRTPT
jgi:hypothetical protein